MTTLQTLRRQRITERIWLSCLRHSAQIPLRGTSDTLGTLGEISNSPSHMNVKLNHQTGLASLNHETERKSNNFIHRNNIDHDAWRIIKCQHSS